MAILEFADNGLTDFPLLLEWLTKEHVKRWWNTSEDTREKVARNYGAEELWLKQAAPDLIG